MVCLTCQSYTCEYMLILKFLICFRDTETRRTKFSEWLMESYQFYGLFVKKVSAVCTV